MGHQTADTRDSGQWLPLGRAALHLGVAQRTVRRRVDAGRYQARRQGREVLVLIPDSGQETRDDTRHEIRPLPLTSDTSAFGAADRRQGTPDTPEVVNSATDPALTVLERLLDEERGNLQRERERSLQMAQAAAMWQERARNLEVQVEQLLALPAHEEEPASARRWWRFWRQAD